MGMFFHSSAAPPERPADPAVRRANLRRIWPLFAHYRLRLGGLVGLIVVAAALGVIPAFLLKHVITAITTSNARALSYNAGGMIAIAIATGVLGVIQTLLSNQVGQRVMHDLRAAVFRHLQRLSLAFFTRTRTGEVQSRISNDIGGVQNVVTNTATSIASNVTTVIATAVGMALLNWELALFAFALIPFFVLLTRRVGNERRRIAKTTQETLADISSLVQESLSVSGILLGKTMGRSNELADRFEADSLRLSNLEVRQRMAGRWVMSAIQMSFSIMPAAVYWFGGLALAHGSHAISIPTLVAFTNQFPGKVVGPNALLVSNDGTGEMRYAMTSVSTNVDTKGLRNQLVLDVSLMTGATCATVNPTPIYNGPLADAVIGDPAEGGQTGDRILAAGASETLCFTTTFPRSSGNTFMLAATDTTFTFDAEQTYVNP